MATWKLEKRTLHFEIPYAKPVTTTVQAVRFIDHVGFCALFPVKTVPLPSLYFAASKKPGAYWDKYAELIWKWKDELPKKRQAFYGKYFKGRGTFISLKLLPQFLAMNETALAPDDAEDFYAGGHISRDALELWQSLALHGAMPTLELRHACKMDTQPGNKRFKKAILELQKLLIVTHSGAEQETESWASNRFDLVSRCFPKQVAAAQAISPEQARATLAQKYLALFPQSSPSPIARLFTWTKPQTQAALPL
jgi:hypothetical protein